MYVLLCTAPALSLTTLSSLVPSAAAIIFITDANILANYLNWIIHADIYINFEQQISHPEKKKNCVQEKFTKVQTSVTS